MAINPKFPTLWHGGDYNPDQWPEEVRLDDVRLMKLAHTNTMSVAVFAWSQLEPRPGQYDWDWLDQTFDRLHGAGVHIALATPSSTPPRWLSAAHPDILQADESGQRVRHGSRQRFCPASAVYREHVARINTALATRYGTHPALALWHISNEYHLDCYCDTCAAHFRTWLQQRYGDIETLNHQWWGAFWSQRYSDWSEVHPPYANAAPRAWTGLSLDWKRFCSHITVEFLKFEIGTVRPHTPGVPVTNNLMGLFYECDYAKFADVIDVVSWDSYPAVGEPNTALTTAFTHAVMRGIKDNRPWLLIEQTPSATNWQTYATLKPPGLMRMWSWQAMAHGSDGAMYFQWRRSLGGPEKLHGAIVEHAGRTDARVFQEVAQLGAEMEKLSSAVVGTTVAPARVGILWDQECRWAFELSQGYAKDKNYAQTLMKHYAALWRQNIPVNIVRHDADWSQYDVIIAPVMYMVRSGRFPLAGSPEQMRTKLDEGAKIEAFVNAGGTFVTTYLSGIANENDHVYSTGYPGPLRKVLGLWSEEIDCNAAGKTPNTLNFAGNILPASAYACDRFFDQIHPEGCEVLATYGSNWYAGRPALTRNTFGKGHAYYIATDAADDFLRDFYATLAAARGIAPLAPAVEGVEVLQRTAGDRALTFIMNHNAAPAATPVPAGMDLLTGNAVTSPATLPPYCVLIVRS